MRIRRFRPPRTGAAPRRARAMRRGATLLPSLLTVGNLFAGFFAIMAATDDRPVQAASALMVAALLDLLDGRIARLTDSSSEFGTQLDSLADAVSFAVAPAVLAQQWALLPLQRVGWCAAFLFAACGVIRLARFNARHVLSDNRYFTGLPVPMAAVSVASAVLLGTEVGGVPPAWLTALAVVAMALLMISSVRYRSFKQLDLRSRPYLSAAIFAVFIAAVAAKPEVVMALLASTYVLSAPAEALWRHRSVAATREAPSPVGQERGDSLG